MEDAQFKTTPEKIKEITVFVPLVTGYAILYGTLSANTYYIQFGVSIINYIDFSEIITFFIKDIYVVLAQLFFLFVYLKAYKTFVKISVNFFKKDQEDRKLLVQVIKREIVEYGDKITTMEADHVDHEKIERSMDEAERISNKIARRAIWKVVSLIVIALAGLFGSLYATGFDIQYFGYLAGLGIICFVSFTITSNVKESMALVSLLLLLMSGVIVSIDAASRVKKGGNYGVNFSLDGVEVKSDSVNYAIGKTNKYIFYYKSREKKTIAYPLERTGFIEVPNKP